MIIELPLIDKWFTILTPVTYTAGVLYIIFAIFNVFNNISFISYLRQRWKFFLLCGIIILCIPSALLYIAPIRTGSSLIVRFTMAIAYLIEFMFMLYLGSFFLYITKLRSPRITFGETSKRIIIAIIIVLWVLNLTGGYKP